MLTTYQASYRAPLLASLLLILTLLQGSSFTLSIAFRGPFASGTLVSMVTLAWLGMYAIALVGLFASFGINWLTWLVRYRLLLICITAGVVFSTGWSLDAGLTIERAVHLVGSSFIALYLGLSLPLNRILKVSGVILGLLMVASVLAVLVFPNSLGLQEYEGQLAWAGVLASKNTLGFWSAITILLLLSLCTWTVSSGFRLLCLILTLFALICLYNSMSATSLLALITGGAVMTYLYVAFNFRLGLTAMLLLGVLVAALAGLAFNLIDTAALIGRSGDLTGRTEVWAQTWQLILERPLTGYGYGTIWFPTPDTVWIQKSLTDLTWVAFHAHNGLLQVASEIGLPLTALTVLMIAQQFIEIIYCQYQRQQPGVLFVLGFTVALMLSNYSEARLLLNRDLYWILFIMLPVSMLQQVSVINEQGALQSGRAWTARPGEKLREAREKVQRKRSFKNRIRQRNAINQASIEQLKQAPALPASPSVQGPQGSTPQHKPLKSAPHDDRHDSAVRPDHLTIRQSPGPVRKRPE